LIITFNSYGQGNTITFTHNRYLFQTDVETILNYLQIEDDSIDLYTNKIIEVINRKSELPSDSTIEIGKLTLDFNDMIHIFNENHSSVKISRESDGETVKYKVKSIKEKTDSHGIGGSDKTILIIIDRKKRVEIAREIIGISLAC